MCIKVCLEYRTLFLLYCLGPFQKLNDRLGWMTREELEEGQMDCPKTFQGTITKANLDGYLVYKNKIILIVCRDDSEKNTYCLYQHLFMLIFRRKKNMDVYTKIPC